LVGIGFIGLIGVLPKALPLLGSKADQFILVTWFNHASSQTWKFHVHAPGGATALAAGTTPTAMLFMVVVMRVGTPSDLDSASPTAA
jgi:hypothetical protein